ncbi:MULTISPECIES: lycopene cyclase domain-containing protein [unclassified Solwaraspora]|uniref:lycopene cyclase domain-containing protein n=1 Tax=unclassified Solwaraspora TaxID=2627926 RepID=UPI00248B3F08|nr:MULTISPECIES: lycopene cyclase domain-containing protein [unclassified Solwaraspora]WBB95094.1 lycopene cyclase domain-containing protein [Solwaraspora sp. WMMA2059]WBC21022.1 lycopene cyclase domain-containing protein [Solwaraspora sp. WMMA2080]WJK36887.1 lycopene cyclase domain-containing protein [Solwaraspora sp. WMMA2065]
MGQLSYLAVLAGCLFAAIWLEPVLRVNVLRRWRRLSLTLLAVVVVFAAWDLAAIAAGHWSFDPAQTTGVLLPGRLPLDELLFFVVVPICTVLGFEAVRAVRTPPGRPRRPDDRWSAGDEADHRPAGDEADRSRGGDGADAGRRRVR